MLDRGLRAGPPARSSSPASPPTCTGCSRCSTPPSRTGARSRYVGRSMVRNMGVARDLGYLTVPDGLLVDLSEVDDSARTTGRADVHRLAGRADGGAVPDGQPRPPRRQIGRATPSSSPRRLIPGNENAVFRVINGLTRLGANVVHKGNALVHVSGHASAGELLYCYNIVRPRNVMPVHGESRHLRRQRRARGARPASRASASSWPRTASSSTWSTGVARGRRRSVDVRLRLRRRLARRRDHRTPTSRTGASSARRASSPSSWSWTPRPARWSAARRSTPAASPRTRRCSTRSSRAIADALAEAASGASATPTSCSRSCGGRSGAGSTTRYRRRPMIIPLVVEA